MSPLLMMGRAGRGGREQHRLSGVAVEGGAKSTMPTGGLYFRVVNHVGLVIIVGVCHREWLGLLNELMRRQFIDLPSGSTWFWNAGVG